MSIIETMTEDYNVIEFNEIMNDEHRKSLSDEKQKLRDLIKKRRFSFLLTNKQKFTHLRKIVSSMDAILFYETGIHDFETNGVSFSQQSHKYKYGTLMLQFTIFVNIISMDGMGNLLETYNDVLERLRKLTTLDSKGLCSVIQGIGNSRYKQSY